MIIEILGYVIFVAGSTLDIMSSRGKYEANPLWKNKDKTFNATKNLIATAIVLIVFILLATVWHTSAGMALGFIGVIRALVSIYNFRNKNAKKKPDS